MCGNLRVSFILSVCHNGHPLLTFHCANPAPSYEPPVPVGSSPQSPLLVPWPEFCKASEEWQTDNLASDLNKAEKDRDTGKVGRDLYLQRNTVRPPAGPEVPSSVPHCPCIVWWAHKQTNHWHQTLQFPPPIKTPIESFNNRSYITQIILKGMFRYFAFFVG